MSLDDRNFDNDAIQLICIAAFDDNVRNINKISNALSIDVLKLKEVLERTPILTLKNDEVSFVSKSFRVYAQTKLKKFEPKISSLLINYFTDKDDIDSIINLPNLFEKKQDWESTVNLLNHENLGLIISKSKSFSDIKKLINYGYKASTHLNQSYSNVFKFSLYRSVVNGIQAADNKESKIQAYIALGKEQEVLSFISSISLKEDRVRMLILFVKECKKNKKEFDNTIIDDIQEIIKDLDADYLKENLVEIVTGLAYFLPDLAVQLVEKASGLKTEKKSVEWLLGYIALIIKRGTSTLIDGESAGVTSDIKDKASDSFANKFSKSIAFGITDVSEDDILTELAKIEGISDKLYVLRRWIKKHKEASNIVDIIEYGIDLMLQDSYNVKPTTTMLLDMAYPILFFKSYDLVKKVVERMDELSLTITSPSIDKVKLQMLLVDSISKFDIETANIRVLEAYYNYIEALNDLSVKVESLAILWGSITSIAKHKEVDISQFILDAPSTKLKILETVKELLSSTANHFGELESTIEILARLDLTFALSIAAMLNTEMRRTYAKVLCIETYVDKPIKSWDVELLKESVGTIELTTLYTKAVMVIFDAAYEQRSETVDCRGSIVALMPLISKVLGNSYKCYLVTQVIFLLKLQPKIQDRFAPNYSSLVVKLSAFLSDYWNKMDLPWEKIMVGYQMVSQLAENHKELAEDYFIRTERLIEECAVDNHAHSSMLMDSIRIMIRAYAGILQSDKVMPYDKISVMIGYMPSGIEQVQLWSELAVKAGLVPVKAVTEEIVSKRIMPIIEQYKKSKDKLYYHYILRTAAAAIHLAQPEALKLLMEPVPTAEKEAIISSVCFVLLTKCHDTDPFDEIKGSPNFKYQDAIEYIGLVSMMESDVAIYDHISKICLVAKNFPNNFLRDHKNEITKRLNKLINEKLPNHKKGVAHNGYVIAAKACLQHFSLLHSNSQTAVFDDLGEQAKGIDNISDKSLVYSILAKECGVKKKKIEFITLAFDEADKIKSLKEKIDRYEVALETVLKFSQEIFNEKILKINVEVYQLDDTELFPTFRRLVDMAYKHDKNLAQKLISTLDTDPARKRMSEPATDHVSRLELEKEVMADYSQFSRIRDKKQMSNMAWQMLGQLNADKRSSRDIEKTSAVLRNASKNAFSYSLPVFEFFLQSVIKESGNSSKNLLLSFYDSAYSNAKLAYTLICNASNKNSLHLSYSAVESNSIFVAKPGMKKDAIDFIGRHLKDSNSTDLYILDPYFSDSDFDFLRVVYDTCYGANVTVLTGGEASGDFSKFGYSNAWKEVSSEELNNYSFIKATNQVNKSPFHDRYIIMHDKMMGIRMGTSLNSIGLNTISEVSVMTPENVQHIYNTVVIPLAKQRVREYSSESVDHTVKYESFDM